MKDNKKEKIREAMNKAHQHYKQTYGNEQQ